MQEISSAGFVPTGNRSPLAFVPGIRVVGEVRRRIFPAIPTRQCRSRSSRADGPARVAPGSDPSQRAATTVTRRPSSTPARSLDVFRVTLRRLRATPSGGPCFRGGHAPPRRSGWRWWPAPVSGARPRRPASPWPARPRPPSPARPDRACAPAHRGCSGRGGPRLRGGHPCAREGGRCRTPSRGPRSLPVGQARTLSPRCSGARRG